tara:strand:+ start:718 stop:1065 length:348 start_codon:yes stop_codon:yes gene_type:complete
LQNKKEYAIMKNKKENEVTGTIWKVFSNEDGNHYRLQIEGIKGKREKKKVLSTVDGWHEIGFGWTKDQQEETILLARNFKEPDSWQNWARQFPFELREVNRNGKIKKVKFKKKEG